MTPTQRQNFFGTSEKKKFGSTPQHEVARQVREATARGQAEINETRRILATDDASSANKRAAAAAAQERNAPIHAMLLNGGGKGFNPLATTKKS